jgi:hypothetical protein
MEFYMVDNCMQEGASKGVALHRDNSRFAFFRENGKPQLPENCEGTLSIVPVLYQIRKDALAQ